MVNWENHDEIHLQKFGKPFISRPDQVKMAGDVRRRLWELASKEEAWSTGHLQTDLYSLDGHKTKFKFELPGSGSAE